MVVPIHRQKMSLYETPTTPTTTTTLCNRSTSSSVDWDNLMNEHEYGSSMLSPEEDAALPLHRALEEYSMHCIADPDSAILLEQRIKDMIRTRPDLVSHYNDEGLNALHVACKEGATLSVIMDLVNTSLYVLETVTRNKRQMLPLHLLCRYYSGPAESMCAIVTYLISIFPESVRCTTGTGELALHLCCQNPFCTLPLIEILVRAYPDAVRISTHKKQQLPLHLACERHYFQRVNGGKNHKSDKSIVEINSSSHDVIRYLLKAHPESVMCFNSKGELPIHAAVRGYQKPMTIQFLLSVFPDSIQYLDDSGRTPLHIGAAKCLPDFTTLGLLLQADPTAATVLDDRDRIPLHYAAANGHLDLIYTLLRGSPTSIEVLRRL